MRASAKGPEASDDVQRQEPSAVERTLAPSSRLAAVHAAIAELQRSSGNAAVARLLARSGMSSPALLQRQGSGGAGGQGPVSGEGGQRGAGPGTGEPSHPTVSRPLTRAEIEYAAGFFGDALNYGAIEITRWSILAEDGISRTFGNTINMAHKYFVLDTLDLTGDGLTNLIHEMTHCWQSQHGDWAALDSLWVQSRAKFRTGSRMAAYVWRPLDDAGVPWEEWNVEQQAQLVQEYQMALRAQQAGTATARDRATLKRAAKYIDKIKAGPQGAGGAPATPG
jgi:hypothetical protein